MAICRNAQPKGSNQSEYFAKIRRRELARLMFRHARVQCQARMVPRDDAAYFDIDDHRVHVVASYARSTRHRDISSSMSVRR